MKTNNINDIVDRIDVIDIQPAEYILFRFPADKYEIKEANEIFKAFCKKFKTKNIVCYPDDTSLNFFTKEEMLKWINNIKEFIEGYDCDE